MAKAWMPLYVGDFLADTNHLNAAETGAYIRLIMHYWSNDGLPTDETSLCRISRVHPPHWNRIRSKIAPFFGNPIPGGSWIQKRIDLELSKSAKISNVRKAAALQKHSKSTSNVVVLHTQSQSQSHAKLDSSDSLRRESSESHVSYFFEEGVIRLTEADYNKWVKAFPLLSLQAELIALAPWAAKQPNWYMAISGALAKRQREAHGKATPMQHYPNAKPWL